MLTSNFNAVVYSHWFLGVFSPHRPYRMTVQLDDMMIPNTVMKFYKEKLEQERRNVPRSEVRHPGNGFVDTRCCAVLTNNKAIELLEPEKSPDNDSREAERVPEIQSSTRVSI